MFSRRDLLQAALSAMVVPEINSSLNMAASQEPTPIAPVPSPRHLPWHKLEYYAFVHFNMNTYTGKEWGEGYEDPKLFMPEKLDCNQWVKVFKEAGMKAVIITAKHHDGFCLWPSEYTDHSVKSSNWRGGKGDVLRELSDACHKQGLKFGVYLSPWDRNHPLYGTPSYNDFFKRQLTEVLSNYGEIFEVWFDGANGEGPNGRKQTYDFPGFIDVVRKCQPKAVIFSDAGPDVRWVGNESGRSNPTSWAMLKRDEFYPGTPRSAELTSGHEDGTHWVPAECDVSIRPGWFFRDSETRRIKSVKQLMDIYYASVGQNGSLLLNVPANKEGLIAPEDALRLREFKAARDLAFGTDLAFRKSVKASSTWKNKAAFSGGNVTAGKSGKFWAASEDDSISKLVIELGNPQKFNVVRLREEIRLGQRVEAFKISARVNGNWQRFFEGTTIGNCRIVQGEEVVADAVELVISRSRACPTISQISVFDAPKL